MMNNSTFYQRVQNFLLPKTGTIQELRERILRILTILIIAIGIPMLVLIFPNFVENNNWAFLIFSVVAFAYLIILAISGERLTYLFRSISVIVISYIFAALSFENFGLVGSGRIWLVLFNVLTTILIGLRAGLAANMISIATFTSFGYLITGQTVLVQNTIGLDYSLSPSSWLTTGATLGFISLVLTFAAGVLIRGLEVSRQNLEGSYQNSIELTNQLADEQNQLEKQTNDLEKRLVQIRTAAEISRTLGTIRDPQDLLQQVVDLIQSRFGLYYVGVFLLDENRRFAILVAGSGDAGQRMVAENHQLSVGGSSMVGWTTSHGKPRISLDVGKEPIRYKNPHLPQTRSELALPLAIGTQISGAISIQSTQPDAFDDDDIVILQSIADSLAIALENARLFEQFERSLREIQQLNRQYMTDSWQKIWASEEDQGTSTETGTLPGNTNISEIDIPLILRGDQVIGNISFATEQSELSPEEREFIEAISNQTALALESARLLDEANKRVEQERAIRKLTADFSRSLDFETLLHTVVEELGRIPLVKETSIHVKPPENFELMREDEAQQDKGLKK
ncbi:MAG: GAF domain-containing protein [Anaerolineales bacterium]|jgi:GAF domain-containing protein